MTAVTSPTRSFEVARSSADGLIRIKRADTGRVTLALSVEEADQIRAGLKGALRSNGKKPAKKGSKKRS